MNRLLILNFFFALLWPTLNGEFNLPTLVIGLLLGFVVLALVKRNYGRFILGTAAFIVYILYAILYSNLRLAWLVIWALYDPKGRLHPGIIALPLAVEDPFDRTLLASIITLTPGTLSIDLGHTDEGDVLYIHAIEVQDVPAFRQGIKANFESRILRLRHFAEDLDTDEESVAVRRRR